MTVLAPDIRDAFGVSDGVIVFITSASAAFFVLGAVPMGYLADRHKRGPIVGVASLVFSAHGVPLRAGGQHAFMLFWTRFGAGIAKANTLPVHGSLLADTYPISHARRIAATTSMVGQVQAISPCSQSAAFALLVRVALAVPAPRGAGRVVRRARLPRSPNRPAGSGRSAMSCTRCSRTPRPAPISMEAAFARLSGSARCARSCRVRRARLQPVHRPGARQSVHGRRLRPRCSPTRRRHVDRRVRQPLRSCRGSAATSTAPTAATRRGASDDRPLHRADGGRLPLLFLMPTDLVHHRRGRSGACSRSAAFSMVTPLIQHVCRTGSEAWHAMITLYIFLFGAIGGSLRRRGHERVQHHRRRVLLAIPANLIGGMLIYRSSRFIRGDLSLAVLELQEEHGRASATGGAPRRGRRRSR